MTTKHIKPKLVFFQYRYDEHLPEFLLIHTRDHVRCLSEFFDVTVIHDDCDYQEICDKYEPDLALFESGVNHATCHRPKVTNVRAYPSVPRVGLHNADAFCNARSGFLSDMDHLGIETFFSICTTTPEHNPEIADNLFVWPNCINPDVYRDYGQWKSVPVLFSGNTNAVYPWRQRILRLVSERYPSLICPHAGYDPGAAPVQVVFGERYARMINAAMMAPACGTIAREAVRKHFEIPACNCCLVTERSAALEAAGFVDMENCVFADEHDVLDKLQHLFQNADELRQITERGHQLVHTRHTFRQRDQIFQWYSLQKSLQPHQAIVQSNPFGPMAVVDKASGIKSAHVRSESLHLGLLRDGDAALRAGRYVDAENLYLKCMNYMRWMPEPKFGLALSRLYQGDAKTAHSLISEQIEFILAGYEAIDPDPIEWAYYILSLLCLGKLEEADRAARQFAWLRHPELNRARWVVNLVSGGTWDSLPSFGEKRRRTIHRLPNRDWSEWLDEVCVMLRACGQQGFADRLTRPVGSSGSPEDVAGSRHDLTASLGDTLTGIERQSPDEAFAAPDVSGMFTRRFKKRATGSALRRVVARAFHQLEARFGYFLPYHLSSMKKDEFLCELRDLGKNLQIKTAIVIGTGHTAGSLEALLAGISETAAKPDVFCIDGSTRRFRRFQKMFAGRVRGYGVRSSSPAEFSQNLDTTIKGIKDEQHIDAWDAVIIDGSVVDDLNVIAGELQQDLRRAQLVVFDGTNNMGIHEHHDRLLNDPNYVLVAHNPGLRGGYAIHKRATRRQADENDWTPPAPSRRPTLDAPAQRPSDTLPAFTR
jgi:hypothetical protein